MRHAFLIAPLVVLACTSQQALNAQYAGEPLTAVFTDLGPPDEANALDGGQTEYIWRDIPSEEEGVENCFIRVLTDGSGTVKSAGKSDGLGPC